MPASQPPTADTIRAARLSQRGANGKPLTRMEFAARLAGATEEEYEMAKRIQHLFKGITLWETGKRTPSPAYADLIRRTLDITD